MATTTSKPSKVTSTGNFYTTSVTTNTDGSLKATTSRTDAQGNNGVPVSTVNTTSAGVSTRTPESGATTAETSAFNNPNSQERQAYTQQVQSQNPYGPNPTAAQKQAVNGAAGNPNAATETETGGAVDGRNFDDDIKGSNKTRDKFPILVYPTKLAESKQDIIRFNMLKYDPKKFSTERGNLGGFEERQVRNSIGTVTLPIPNGISDTNAVTWGGETMNAVEAMLGNIALTSIKSGFAAGAGEVQKTGENLQSGSKEVQSGLAAAFTSLALGQSGGQFLSRTAGAVLNPNLELLFSAPTLRPFNFTFKLASRSEDESKTIRSIIRFFKQGMSPIRSQSNLFLKAPHTFQIQYLHRNEEHKFLNKFKECALQSFNVSYTPEGQYATFTDGAMVSYQITMQFQELEPVFNDDYTSLDQNKDTEIGF
jgi:hypothetical protein